MTSVLDFMGYNTKTEEAAGASSQAFQWVFWVFSCFHLLLSLLLGSVCFPSPNQPKLLSGASVPVIPKAVQIFVSDPHQPFCCGPANSTFLSLLQAQRISKGHREKTLLSLPVFFQELIDLPSPSLSGRSEKPP